MNMRSLPTYLATAALLPRYGHRDAAVRLGYRQGPGLIALHNASWVSVRDVVVTSSMGTAVSISGGAHNTVSGCTLKDSSGGVVIAGGHHHRVLGNDIYDVGTHIQTSGNAADGLEDLVPTNNLIANNHLTQVCERRSWQIRLLTLALTLILTLTPYA